VRTSAPVTTSDLGILSRDSVARRVNRESFLLLGGTAALLLQVGHPLVAAGVSEHSDFRRDPVGRLMRTLNTTLAVVFGTRAQARAALARIDRRHASVRGVAGSGRAYDARDAALVTWVQVTLVLTSLRLYEHVRGRLSDPDRETYWAEARSVAKELGATETSLPATFDALLRYERHMLATEVVPDSRAVAVARQVLRPFAWPAIVHWPMEAFTAGLLPPSLRLAFGLPWRRRERLYFRFVVVALRRYISLVPSRVRIVPQARGYEARLR
jgi:uncharacterized protein (DUF2236 family)